MSVRAIEQLEGGRISELPEGIYRRSIVRAVAREVGLNPDQLLAEFTKQHPDDLSTPAATAVVAVKPISTFQKALAFVSAMLPMAAAALYFALPTQRAPVSVMPPSTSEQRAEPMRAEVVPVGGLIEPALVTPRPVVVTLTISARCQLRVVADGAEILSRVMVPGETVPIELGDELLLLGDNASAVQFSINGQAGRQLGEPGDVLSARIGRDDYQDFLVRY